MSAGLSFAACEGVQAQLLLLVLHSRPDVHPVHLQGGGVFWFGWFGNVATHEAWSYCFDFWTLCDLHGVPFWLSFEEGSA